MQQRNEKIMQWVAGAVIALGVVLRVVVYFQNRNLFIDEVNVARNIYERGLIGLAVPLKYEQFAPVLFLWGVKVCAALLGYGEYALRLVPLLSAVATIYILYKIMLAMGLRHAWWYPLLLLGTAPLLLRYATELKQYSSDAFVTSALVLLALRMPLHTTARSRFVLVWCVVGVLAIYTSMPAVFILVGVGGYYAISALQHAFSFAQWRDRRSVFVQQFITLLPVVCAWVVAFGIYFYTILRAETHNHMLLTFHHDDFMWAQRHVFWWHNWPLFNCIVRKFGETYSFTYNCNLWLMMLGTVVLLVRRPAQWWLLAMPVVCMVVASFMGKYSMIIRLTIFSMPLFVAMAGYGLQQVYNLLRPRAWKLVVTLAALVVASDSCREGIKMVRRNEGVQQITQGFAFFQQRHITGAHLVVYHTAVPAYIYYTTIHPGRNRWASLTGAVKETWDFHLDSLAEDIKSNQHTMRSAPDGFLMTGVGQDEITRYTGTLNAHLHLIDSLDNRNEEVQAYIYTNR